MATLNIKNLPDGLYKKLQARAKRERRSVAQEVTQLLSRVLEVPEPLSILNWLPLWDRAVPRSTNDRRLAAIRGLRIVQLEE